MSVLEEAIRSVEAGPRGPAVGAFFDLDGTLVKGFTAVALLREDLPVVGVRPLVELFRDVYKLRGKPDADVKIIERAAELFEGRSVEDLERLSGRVFRQRVAPTLRPGARELVRAHRRMGHTLVLATAATRFQAEPVAGDLEIPHVVSTEVEIIDGVATGRLDGQPRWGANKARGVEAFAAQHGIDLGESWGYSNGGEDLAFLQAVGRPVAVCPDSQLAAHVATAGIPRLALPDPPPASLRSAARTLSAFGVFNAGLLATMARSILREPSSRGLHPSLATTADLCLRLAGIRMRVQGAEHLEQPRPAIFIINHQSNLDPAVVGALVRHGFTGVGKVEAGSDLRSFALRFLDVALIDRSDSASARASMNALVERVRDGESVIIWPEGTRMPTPRLGRFKKGAFHLAIDAGVPLIPIVLRNTYALWPRGSALIRPGAVDVCVLPPIPTDNWSKEHLNDHVARVRDLFEQTLDTWPKGA